MGATAAAYAVTPMRSAVAARPVTVLRDVNQTGLRCGNCHLRGHCLPSDLAPEALGEMRELVIGQRRVRRGEALYQAGDGFRSIYAVRLGFFKTFIVTEDGRSQITGFQMGGDILGLDGIATEAHTQSAVALEDSEVCVFQYVQLEAVSSRLQALRHQLHRVMSREIVREHGIMLLLGTMRAEERVAAFLINLSRRFLARGYAATEFNLRMTREEVGSYLGLKLETVSRILSRFQESGLIITHNRYVHLLDMLRLTELAGSIAAD